MNGLLATILPWDSAHFGFRIARATPHRLDPASCRELLEICRDQAIDCLYFLADADDADTIRTLQAACFDFVDIRLTFAGNASDMSFLAPKADILFRHAHAGDLDILLPIASNSHSQSRFYIDRRFGRRKASQMYETWLTKSLTTDFADAVVVAEHSGRPVGYVTCHLHSPVGEGNIGLVGMAESARGLGCASGMLKYATNWFSEQGVDRYNVVTQGRNIAAQRLYQRCGFVTRSVELWFHKWFEYPG